MKFVPWCLAAFSSAFIRVVLTPIALILTIILAPLQYALRNSNSKFSDSLDIFCDKLFDILFAPPFGFLTFSVGIWGFIVLLILFA